ncbi:MAG: hypothetical protein Q9220_002516 [cf. Caloplaca sp. 1 TL-2023]
MANDETKSSPSGSSSSIPPASPSASIFSVQWRNLPTQNLTAPRFSNYSILLISPTNEILLLQRVQKSSSFASAHVFPGGHIDKEDGELPPEDDVQIHEDRLAYRIGAIRECFEESGILLARSRRNIDTLLQLDERKRDKGKHAVHEKKVRFQDWLYEHGGISDTLSLHPFTRWLTPANIKRRFSTQMYLYFLPLAHPGLPQTLHLPTSDGGIEHTEACFRPASEWISLAQADKIILFPPQFFLLSLVAQFLQVPTTNGSETPALEALESQRNELMNFVQTGDPPWGEKCISPIPLKKDGKRLIMGLNEPGPELEGTNRKGDAERVIWVQFKGKEGTSGLRVGWKTDIIGEQSKDEESQQYVETSLGERRPENNDEGMERALRGKKASL